MTLTPETPSANEGERRHRAPAAPLAAVAGPLAFGLALIAIVLEAAQGPAGVNPGASESEIAIAYAHASGMLLWVGAYVQVFAYLCLGICLMSLATALRAGRAHWTEPLPGICAGLSLTYVALTLGGVAVGALARYRSGPNRDVAAVTALVDVHVALYIAGWAAVGFAFAGWAVLIVVGGGLPGWTGWSAAVISVTALLAVSLPTSPIAQLRNALVLLWTLAVSIVMLRRLAGDRGVTSSLADRASSPTACCYDRPRRAAGKAR